MMHRVLLLYQHLQSKHNSFQRANWKLQFECQVLEQRLRNRRTETDESIKMRIEKANREMQRAEHFDWILLNDNLEKACLEIKEKVKSFIA